MDHPEPYDPHGPPGQTGDHNAAPLGRGNHRAKTHLAYRARQLGLARYLWRTPGGLRRLVDATGTHEIDTAQALELEHPGALDAALERIEASLRVRAARSVPSPDASSTLPSASRVREP